jgi:eukaryotic-like serine/threonine-protein kinase
MNGFDSDTSVERSVENGWKRPASDPGFASAVDDVPTSRMVRLWLVGGRYELYDEISAGGMGKVFRAVHRDLGRTFALKLMLEGQREKQESRERFFVEARLASSLCHPNIVSVTDYGLDETHGCFIVMEMLEGQTVRARMREGQLLPRLAFDVLDQLTGALRYMHTRGIIHGDIKPENVFLTQVEGEPRRKNIVKLLDFGLSFRSGGAPEHKLGGTPPYLAPERLRGAPPAPSCDVYSLGALLYELLTGRPVYTGALTEVMDKTIGGPPPPLPSTLSPHRLDERVDALVMRALDRDPRKRHHSAEAFHFELRTLMNMTGLRVRRSEGRRAGAVPDARQALESAIQAAARGDLDDVRRILSDAKQRLDTISSMTALQDDVPGPAVDDDGVEEG